MTEGGSQPPQGESRLETKWSSAKGERIHNRESDRFDGRIGFHSLSESSACPCRMDQWDQA